MSSLAIPPVLAGTPCWPAGIDAQKLRHGRHGATTEDMVKAKYIITRARTQPALTRTHEIYLSGANITTRCCRRPPPKPISTRAYAVLQTALALGMHVIWWIKAPVDQDFVNNDAHGYPEFGSLSAQ